MTAVALLGELADVLGQFRNLRTTPVVEMEDGCVVLTLRVSGPDQPGMAEELDVASLFRGLLYVADVATLRALAARYNIEPGELEALLPQKETA